MTIDGKIRTISTSKIKKIIVIKKNCIENGVREDAFWSKPHSNEDNFSRSKIDFFEKIIASIISKLEIIEIKINKNIMFIINYLKYFKLIKS